MYYRAAGQFLIGMPDDKRTLPAYEKCAHCFQEAMKLSTSVKCESVKIPYKGTNLPGYFLTPLHGARKGETLIVNGGYDSVKEECYFFSGASALRRGFQVLLFDGPGQGIPLLAEKLITIPDWENVITPVIDDLHSRPDVGKSKIAAMGISLGGYQIPRAATKEKRLTAIICDPAQINIGVRARARLPLPVSWKPGFPKDTPGFAVALVSMILGRMASDPSGGWTMRRIQHVHGLKHITDMFPDLDHYQYDPKEVTCPAFISWAEKDDIAVESKRFYETCGSTVKKFVQYKEKDGSHEHCEAANRASFNQDAFDWLEELWG